MAFEYEARIYYITTRDIIENEELFVQYGLEFDEDLKEKSMVLYNHILIVLLISNKPLIISEKGERCPSMFAKTTNGTLNGIDPEYAKYFPVSEHKIINQQHQQKQYVKCNEISEITSNYKLSIVTTTARTVS